MEITKICLGHGKVMEFQIFPQIVFSQWLKAYKRNLGNFVSSVKMLIQWAISLLVFTCPLANFEVIGLDQKSCKNHGNPAKQPTTAWH